MSYFKIQHRRKRPPNNCARRHYSKWIPRFCIIQSIKQGCLHIKSCLSWLKSSLCCPVQRTTVPSWSQTISWKMIDFNDNVNVIWASTTDYGFLRKYSMVLSRGWNLPFKSRCIHKSPPGLAKQSGVRILGLLKHLDACFVWSISKLLLNNFFFLRIPLKTKKISSNLLEKLFGFWLESLQSYLLSKQSLH